jgi:hypothetical protein
VVCSRPLVACGDGETLPTNRSATTRAFLDEIQFSLVQQEIMVPKNDIGNRVGIQSTGTSIGIGDASKFMRTLRCSVRNP